MRHKGESQNGSNKKTKHAKFSEKRTFLKKCSLFIKFGLLCFLVTPVLRFALLPFCRGFAIPNFFYMVVVKFFEHYSTLPSCEMSQDFQLISLQRCFIKKVFLQFLKIHTKTPLSKSFLIKLQAPTKVFSRELTKFLTKTWQKLNKTRNTFTRNDSFSIFKLLTKSFLKNNK